jgi:hypothetical protein
MKISSWAGKPVQSSVLANVTKPVSAYYTNIPDPSVSEQRIAFDTSEHRGSALKSSSGDPKILYPRCGWYLLYLGEANAGEHGAIDNEIFQQSRGARIH